MSIKLVTNEKIAETSSKGNQEKWLDSDKWYKIDQFGYEALAETLISRLLEFSNIETDFPFKFVRYYMQKLNVHKLDRVGCVSKNFLKKGESIITVADLIRKSTGKSMSEVFDKISSKKQQIKFMVDEIMRVTGLEYFGEYLTLLFEIDSLFLNDDRHLNNIAVIEKNGKFDYCPIFDNGAGLLSNEINYPMNIEPKGLLKLPVARPFNTTFNRQVIAARSLYGEQLKIKKFSKEAILNELSEIVKYYPERDRGVITDRVVCCIWSRQHNFKKV